MSDETRKAKKTSAETPVSKKEVEAAIKERGEHEPKGGKGAIPAKYMIPSTHAWAGLWKIFAGIGVVGLAMAGASYTSDPKRFAFSYLAAFAWGLTLALGGLFFVLIQHITSAGWSVTVRRGAEQLMGTLPIFVLLFIPVVLFRNHLYPWLGHGHLSEAVEAKRGFLNFPFWMVRAVVFFAIWTFLANKLLGLSREQDETGNPDLTNKMRALAAPGIPLFALSITFGGIDWFMTLDPEWYSTMFGVYLFAGAAISVFAFMNLFFSRANAAKLLTNEVTPEHFHDLGKLQFAFTVFWAYIGFSQYFLIWYANIPEETLFFKHRQENGWGTISIALVLGHFFFPFFLMLSRHTKRVAGPRSFAAAWVLVLHFVDMYWLIMPNVDHHMHFNPLMDLGPILFIMGTMMAVFFKRLADAPIVPARDPRLDRALHFENALAGARDGTPRRRS